MPPQVDPATRLYAAAAQGQQHAALELLQQYLPRLRAFVRTRLSVDLRRRESDSDVVQSVCRELIEHGDGFRFRGESEFRGWLFTAALNKVREKFRFHHQRKRDVQREEHASSSADRSVGRSSAAADYAALANERVAILEAALDRLEESDREIIALSRLAGLPMDQVAAGLGKTAVAARKQLGRALLRLGVELKRCTEAGSAE